MLGMKEKLCIRASKAGCMNYYFCNIRGGMRYSTNIVRIARCLVWVIDLRYQ